MSWKNKNVLCLGDSMTQAGIWTTRLEELLGCHVFRHCKGGLGLIEIVDGGVGAEGILQTLTAELVQQMDLIILYAGYNNRKSPDGKVGECYSPADVTEPTIAGMTQYCINRIYKELSMANNLTCRLLIVTPHCVGRYEYIDADGYGEYPPGSRESMETLSDTMKAVAMSNSIPVLDLWHDSGINKYTWSVYSASPEIENDSYSPYRLDQWGKAESKERIAYIPGEAYYQQRNNQLVLEQYDKTVPYPYNKDQLHCSVRGYQLIGDLIAGRMKSLA
jgi:lysophospholipase L1-like esterase